MKNLTVALLVLLCAFGALGAQDFYDINTVNDIHLYFTQANWDQILDQLYAAGNEERLLGTAIINGVTYDSVGVRYKGNSSYNPNRPKNPFNIKLDYMIEDQLLGPYGTLKLANGFSDPSFIRETLSYEIARKYMPACLANYARVYVNDVQIGIYTSVQDVDSYFMNSHFHCGGKPRFKCDTNTFNAIPVWGYLGADSLAYAQYYGIESDFGWAELMNFTNTMSNNPANLAEVLNIDQNLWMTAWDNLLVNMDSPIQVFHNFYLFADANDRFNPLLWDLNMSFGGFPASGVNGISGMQQMDPLRNSTSNTFLLLSRVLSNARYKKQYLAHMRTMITENFSNGWYATRGSELQAICGPYVQTDPNFFYSYANFVANLNNAVTGGGGGPGGGQSVPGITQLMSARATYLLNHAQFAGVVPAIASVEVSPAIPVANSIVNFTMAVSNASYAHIGVRQEHSGRFVYHELFDDGAHNDGAAGDGVWGVSVEIGTGNLEYFGWAESATQGAFLPARAEHEFFTAEVQLEPGEILINEIQAKNTLYADPNGEMEDWVELYNPQSYPVDIAGMYMTDSHYANGITAWTQIPAGSPAVTTIPPGGYLIVWYDEDLDQGPLHINDKLGGGADSVYLIDSDGSTVIDSKSWVDADGINVDNVSWGRIPDGGTTWQLFGAGQPDPCTPGAANQSAVNVPPTITGIDYDLQIIPPTTAVVIRAQVADSDGTVADVELVWDSGGGTNFTSMLLDNGYYSASIGPFNNGDVITYYIQAQDNDGATSNSATYHIIIGYVAPVLYINELMPSNTMTYADEEGENDDWVEIYNPGDEPVDLAGYFFVDNHFGDPGFSLAAIPSGSPVQTTVPAHGYLIAWFDEDLDQGPMHINTKLGSSADAVYLLAPDMLQVLDQVVYADIAGLEDDVSWGRSPDGGSTWALFGTGMAFPATPCASNHNVTNDDPGVPALKPVLAVSPNPLRNQVTLELKNTEAPARIKVYNIKGQNVAEIDYAGKTSWLAADFRGQPLGEGVYLLKATVNGQDVQRKICIVK